MSQKIICSAIHFDDGIFHIHQPKNIKTGFVVCGMRHHNIFTTLSIILNGNRSMLPNEKEQGFLTDDDMFLNRVDAYVLAKENGQFNRRGNNTNEVLFSEDIY